MILEPNAEAPWLDLSLYAEDALELLKVYLSVELEAVPADKRVGNVKFDEPEAIEPKMHYR